MTARPWAKALPCRGFTLIELMVTVALLAILLAVAAPSFVSFRRNSELVAVANGFVGAVNAARSEAMKRNMFAMVTPVGNDADWLKGWVVFVDANDNSEYDSGDIVILRQEAVPDFISISGNGSTAATKAYVRYDGSGFSRPLNSDPANTTLSISRSDAASDYSQIRRIVVALTGRIRVCTPKSASDTNCPAGGDS